jgi:glycosyltransferase involved in cell wall biosynthesis
MIPLSLRKSARVLTVSHSSARDIVRYFPSVQPKLSVTVEGVKRSLAEHREIEPSLVQTELGIDGNFILSAATFGPHKNMRALIHAFAHVHKTLPEIQLVLTGGAGTGDAARERVALKNLARSLDLEERVIFAGFVPERQLAALYRAAQLYVIPSLYEGFGLSVLEAQFFGVPVVCSSTPALVEIGGSGVLVVDAASDTELAAGIVELLRHPERSAQLVERGYDNLSRYSWHHAARDVIDLAKATLRSRS